MEKIFLIYVITIYLRVIPDRHNLPTIFVNESAQKMVGPVPMSLDVPAALACSTNNTIGALLQSCIPTNLP